MKTNSMFTVAATAGLIALLTQGCQTVDNNGKSRGSLFKLNSAGAETLDSQPTEGDVVEMTHVSTPSNIQGMKPVKPGQPVEFVVPEGYRPEYRPDPNAKGNAPAKPIAGTYAKPAPAAPAGIAVVSTYTVKQGDIFGRIANDNGVTISDMKRANPGLNYDKIQVGQKLNIPAKSANFNASKTDAKPSGATVADKDAAGTYTVKKGDILGRIARQHGVKLADLKAANGLTSDNIQVGQRLVIPAQGAASAQRPSRRPPPVNDSAKKPADVKKPADKTPALPAPAEFDSAIDIDSFKTDLPTFDDEADKAKAGAGKAADAAKKTAATALKSAEKYVQHTIKSGEDLYTLGYTYNVSPEELANINNIDGLEVPVGTIIKIPVANK